MNKFLIIILTLVSATIIIVSLFFIFKNDKSEQTQILSEENPEYRNVSRNFSLRYPKELAVKEYDEGDTTYTIIFENEEDRESFQIFFTPYSDNAVTKSRLLMDIPNGKFTDPVEVVLGDGTHALAFFSEGELGEMREVWFIHDGYLFEVTAYKELDAWLAEIMKSWQFYAVPAAGS